LDFVLARPAQRYLNTHTKLGHDSQILTLDISEKDLAYVLKSFRLLSAVGDVYTVS